MVTDLFGSFVCPALMLKRELQQPLIKNRKGTSDAADTISLLPFEFFQAKWNWKELKPDFYRLS